MSYHFNPPPNWPLPPGWSPPPDWRPDPTWPPAPPGWVFWTTDDSTPSGNAPGAGTGTLIENGRDLATRAGVRFRGLPLWGRILAVVLLIGLLPWLLIVAGLAVAGVGVVSLSRGGPARIRLATPAAALAALVVGLAGAGAGTTLAVAVVGAQSQPSAAPRTAAPSPAFTVAAPTTPASDTPTPTPTPTPLPTTVRATPTVTPHTARPPVRPPPPPPVTRTPPTTRPAPVPVSLCGAPHNPFGYNFCGRGGLITSPAEGVCSYFSCIANFDNGVGHMEECQDATYSMSGGRHGSCSHHGGNLRPVYAGP